MQKMLLSRLSFDSSVIILSIRHILKYIYGKVGRVSIFSLVMHTIVNSNENSLKTIAIKAKVIFVTFSISLVISVSGKNVRIKNIFLSIVFIVHLYNYYINNNLCKTE